MRPALTRQTVTAAMLAAVFGAAECRAGAAGGPAAPGVVPLGAGDVPATDAGFVCPGIGVAGVTLRAVIPDTDALAPGAGAGLSSHGSLALVMRADYGVWTLREAGTDRWSGMAEASVGLGAPRRPVTLLGGVGFALPLWDSGSLDLDPMLLAYAELWAPVGGGSGRRGASLAIRRTWYSDGATLAGEGVDLDGWSASLTLHF